MPELTPEQQKALQEKLQKMSPEELLAFQKQQCIFCQIISNKIPAKRIHEDDKCIAILDINPAARGHLLIIPKEHYSIMPQMPDEITGHLFTVSQKLSQLLLRSFRSDGTTVFVANGLAAGQRSQHFLLHLIPRKEDDALLTLDEKLLSPEELGQVHSAIIPKLNQLLGIKTPAPVKEIPLKTVPAPTKSKPKIKETPAPKPELKNKPKEEVSLDDIANLFK